MMTYKNLLIAALLPLSSTMAAGVRRVQEETLGELFLAEATDVTDTPTTTTLQRDSSMGAEFEDDILLSLGEDINAVCADLGYVENESQYQDTTSGQVQSYSVTCRFENETFDEAYTAIRSAITAANPTSASYSSSSYNQGYGYDIGNQMAQRKGLETLLRMADTFEQVVQVIPLWQNTAYYNYPVTSSISVNLNKAYDNYGEEGDDNYGEEGEYFPNDNGALGGFPPENSNDSDMNNDNDGGRNLRRNAIPRPRKAPVPPRHFGGRK